MAGGDRNIQKKKKFSGNPAPHDNSTAGSVSYPQNKEGGLNKFSNGEKDARNAKAIDNFNITLKERYGHQAKSATDIMGLTIEAH